MKSRTRRKHGRKANPSQQAARAALDRDLAEMWAEYERTDTPGDPRRWPHALALYEFALGSYQNSATVQRTRRFNYIGMRFRIEITCLGRLRVLDEARRLLISGPLGEQL